MTENTETTVTKLPMACVCKSENREALENLRQGISKRIGNKDPNSFVSYIVASLEWDFDCSIEGIDSDQWFGIQLRRKDEIIRIECDRVEDGLAKVWDYLDQTYENQKEISD